MAGTANEIAQEYPLVTPGGLTIGRCSIDGNGRRRIVVKRGKYTETVPAEYIMRQIVSTGADDAERGRQDHKAPELPDVPP